MRLVLPVLLVLTACGKRPEPPPVPKAESSPKEEDLVRREELADLGFPEETRMAVQTVEAGRVEQQVVSAGYAIQLYLRVESYSDGSEAARAFAIRRKEDGEQAPAGGGTVEDGEGEEFRILTARKVQGEERTIRSVQTVRRAGKHVLTVGAANSLQEDVEEVRLRDMVSRVAAQVGSRLAVP